MKTLILKKIRLIFTLAVIMSVLFAIPQLAEPVHAATATAGTQSNPAKYKMTNSSYEINSSGWYEFSGETSSNYIKVSSKGKVYIILNNVKIDLGSGKKHPAIDIQSGSNVTILLEGKNYLHGGKKDSIWTTDDGYAGIRVTSDSEVTITTLNPGGSLEAVGWQGRRGAAGIGTNYDADGYDIESCGKIMIGLPNEMPEYGPTIIARGGGQSGDSKKDEGAAGIGGGFDGNATKGIIINNGHVTAIGGDGAAGIGSGESRTATEGGNVKNIEINGGTVIAQGGREAAGIGGGEAPEDDYFGGGKVESIKITGGQITATGGKNGAGIGGGEGSNVSVINIEKLPKGSYIKAYGGENGAGIGSASGYAGEINISLNGGKVEATGGKDGAGIGGGNGKSGTINITGHGKITAKGYDESAAIGAGYNAEGGNINISGEYYKGSSSQKNNQTYSESDYALVISAANNHKSSDNDAAVIGGADSKGGNINIKNAYITLASKTDTEGAGIGSGANSSMIADDMGNIKIENCYIYDETAADRYAPTVGVGKSSDLDNIEIINSYVKGAGVGSSDLQASFLTDPTINISIKKSNIIADAGTIAGSKRINARAAIGSGCYGAVKSISIEDSSVTAKTEAGAGIGSGGYYADDSSGELNWNGGACGNITIKNSDITANGAEGGAGIGGGWGTSAGNIIIEGSNVEAHGTSVKTGSGYKGSAGIGSGWAESCGYITITNSNVTATGSENGAGIGCSGSKDKYASFGWGGKVGAITIEDADVIAHGGEGAAGIGTGEGAVFADNAEIKITGDCKIKTAGGAGGAGIGGGRAGHDNIGGESCPITIDLDKTEYKENPEDAANYVIAEGGDGAAGIGSGGARSSGASPNDAEVISIQGGYVYAQGGKEGNIQGGAGAGIGGGNGGAKLKSLIVDGGIVDAHAGYAQKRNAFDIGSGGNDDARSDYKSKVTIRKGTVWGWISNDGNNTVVYGGSVNYLNEAAKNSKGAKVYQTRMKIHEAGHNPTSYAVTSCTSYNVKDIYSDKDKRIYLYLPESAEDEATAQYYSDKKDMYQYYYGTTRTDNSGWMKMDGKLYFKNAEEHTVGDEFVLELNDDELSGAVDFKLTQNSSGEKCINIVEVNNTAPGAWIKLMATDRVSYTVEVTANNSADHEMYWNAKGAFSETITRTKEEIVNVEDLTKIYDAEEVQNPQITLKSGRTDTKITYKYYKKDGTYLGDGVKPVNAGNYYVAVSVAADEKYTEAETKKAFEIRKRMLTLGVTTEPKEGNYAIIKVHAFNAVSDPGYVSIFFNKKSGPAVNSNIASFKNTEEGWVAEASFRSVDANTEYIVKAIYAGTFNYYNCNEQTTFSYQKTRDIEVNDITAVYGDGPGVLEVSLSRDGNDPENEYSYKIISDFTDTVNDIESVKPTVKLDANGGTAEVSYENAGYAVVEVTVKHPEYDDIVDYAEITVNKAPLTVKSYAQNSGKEIKEVTYGKTDALRYGLNYYGFVNGDYALNFLQAGSLEAAPLPETAPVGKHEIGITKIGGKPVQIGDVTVAEPFYCRNYDLTFEYGVIDVLPAKLYVNVNDATGKYGIKEPEYSVTFGDGNGNYGLMPWDAESGIIKSVGIDGEFVKFKPGTYDDVITAVVVDTNYDVTINNGTLTVEKGDLDVQYDVPSFVYNEEMMQYVTAKPVTDPSVDPADMNAPGNPDHTVYYKITEDGVQSKLDAAPVDAGEYMAEIIYEEDDWYNRASATDYFTISKAMYDVETPQVPDIYMKEGLKLSDQPLPKGWAWIDGSRELHVGPVEEEAVYTPENPNYKSKTDVIRFNVLKREADVVITENLSKVYDGKAVSDPDVKVVSDAAKVEYQYYDVTNGKSLGDAAPVTAGKYTVQAYVEETDIYKAAASDKAEFVISKRETALRISAAEDLDGDSAKVELTVEVMVTGGVELDEGSVVSLDISEDAQGVSKSFTSEVKKINGKYAAVFEFEKAAANHYAVYAVFEETANFKYSETIQAFDKEPGERDLDVVIEHPEYMSEETITVPYGTEPEIMTAIPSVKGPYGGSDEDEYSFRVISESEADTVSLTDTGKPDQRKVTFENAGTAVIEVKVTNEAFYSDAVKYVTVVVEKREAQVRSYAYMDGETVSYAPLSVQYGQVGKLKYGLSYIDELGGDGAEVLSVLEVSAVNETAGVNDTGWPVKIIKSGDADAQKEVLRNYDLKEVEGKIYVTPAPLVAAADDVTSPYGHEPEFSCTVTGLMEWDAKGNVVESVGPVMGREYEDLAPGKHDIKVTVKENPNYSMAVKPGVLTITKGTVDVNAEAVSKTYDGQPAEISVEAEPVAVNVDNDKMRKPSDVKVTYFAVDGEGARKGLSGAPVDAGNYILTAEVPEDKYYEKSAIEEAAYTISKRDVALAMYGEETGGTQARITVEVLGTAYIDPSENPEITLDVREDSGEYSKVSTEKVELVDGRYIAEFEFPNAAAVHYTVKASFAETKNHNSAVKEQSFDKEQGERTVDIENEHPELMKDDVITVTYGTDDELITAVPSVEGPYSDNSKDEYFFEIVADSLSGEGEATIALTAADYDDQRNIVFKNAGTAVIEVKVANSDFYSEAVTYVTVVVEPCDAQVTSYAYAAGDDSKTPVTSVQYGQVDTLSYDLMYEDELNGAGEEVLAEMIPVPVGYDAGVKDGGWNIGIDSFLYSRNYEITYIEGTLQVTPAPLTLTAYNTETVYGTEPAFEYAVSGLVPWDDENDVFDTVGLADGKEFADMMPGIYEDIITITAKGNPNYDISVEEGTLTIEKADVQLTASIGSKVYDADPVQAEVTVEPIVVMDSEELEKPENAETVYYEILKNGEAEKLSAAPKDAGDYYAEIIVDENSYYNGASVKEEFTIFKATPDVETPELPDTYITENLKLSDIELPEEWAWVDGSQSLSAGQVYKYAVYTPEDTRNFRSVTRLIDLNVMLNPAEISISSDPSKVYDGTVVSAPEVVKTTDAEDVAFTYYDVTNHVDMGSEEPMKAGTYTVRASVAETDLYTAAESEAKEFTIEKRQVTLELTGEENIGGDMAKDRITVEVLGADGVPMDEGAAITLELRDASGEYSKVSTEAVKLVDGRYIAEFDFSGVAANSYEVRAVFAETENYGGAESEKEFDKDAEEPEIPSEPEEPTEPSDPSAPEDPTEPGDPSEPDDPTEPSEPSDPSEPETPDKGTQTGDDFNLMLWMMIMLTAGALCIVAGTLKTKR